MNYSFLSRYHYKKSKNYLKRRYRNRYSIPMSFETPSRMKTIRKSFFSLHLCKHVHKVHGGLLEEISLMN